MKNGKHPVAAARPQPAAQQAKVGAALASKKRPPLHQGSRGGAAQHYPQKPPRGIRELAGLGLAEILVPIVPAGAQPAAGGGGGGGKQQHKQPRLASPSSPKPPGRLPKGSISKRELAGLLGDQAVLKRVRR